MTAHPTREHSTASSENLRTAALGCRILVVDDQKLNVNIIVSCLERSGYRNIDSAFDGESAIAKAKATPPDLLILDMSMPGMSGIDVCREIRAMAGFSDLPIFIQTAFDGPAERKAAFEAGATDFITKPINPTELSARAGINLERSVLIRRLQEQGHRIDRELQLARRMQLDLLPADERLGALATQAGLDIASYFQTSSELGGDIWGIVDLGAAGLGVYVTDFAGHGVAAALNTFRLHAFIQEIGPAHADPGEFLQALNLRLRRVLPIGQYATMTYVIFPRGAGALSYAAAGSPSPVVRTSADGPFTGLDTAGVPLGITADASYPTHHVPFPEGSRMLLYSDALSEEPDAQGRRLGEDGVRDLVENLSRKESADQVIEAIRAHVASNMARALSDDLTIVCIDRCGGRAK